MNREIAPIFCVPRTKRALLIGMSYMGDRTADYLPCYEFDVTCVKNLIEERYAFRRNNIEIMYDNMNLGTVRPTAINVYRALYDLILKTKFGDTLLFYYSGHGGRHAAGLDSNNSDFLEFICLADQSYISDVTMRTLTEKVVAGSCFTALIDCCHSGGFIEGAAEQIGNSCYDVATGRKFKSLPLDPGLKRPLGTLISACQSFQLAKYNKNKESKMYGSHFTRILVKILTDSKGALTYRELVTRINQEFSSEGYEQRSGLYCSKEQSNRLFLKE